RQGHDAAVYLLWRGVAHRHGFCHGGGAGACPPAANKRHRGRRLADVAGLISGMPGQQRDTKRKLVVVAAGGTGGHLFPAQALAEALVQRDYIVHLMTDERVRDYGKNFPAREVHQISSATLSISKPHRWPLSTWRLWRGYRQALDTLVLLRPLAVAGFGGFPSLPPVPAATALHIS